MTIKFDFWTINFHRHVYVHSKRIVQLRNAWIISSIIWKIITHNSKSKKKSSKFTRHNFDLSKLREWKLVQVRSLSRIIIYSFSSTVLARMKAYTTYPSRSRPPVPTAFSPRAEKKKKKGSDVPAVASSERGEKSRLLTTTYPEAFKIMLFANENEAFSNLHSPWPRAIGVLTAPGLWVQRTDTTTRYTRVSTYDWSVQRVEHRSRLFVIYNRSFHFLLNLFFYIYIYMNLRRFWDASMNFFFFGNLNARTFVDLGCKNIIFIGETGFGF